MKSICEKCGYTFEMQEGFIYKICPNCRENMNLEEDHVNYETII